MNWNESMISSGQGSKFDFLPIIIRARKFETFFKSIDGTLNYKMNIFTCNILVVWTIAMPYIANISFSELVFFC